MSKLNAYLHITRQGKVKRNPVKKIHITKRYVRARIREPNLFSRYSFRTQDFGRKGHTKRIAGQLKSSGKWETQAILFSVNDVLNRDTTVILEMKQMGLPFEKIRNEVVMQRAREWDRENAVPSTGLFSFRESRNANPPINL